MSTTFSKEIQKNGGKNCLRPPARKILFFYPKCSTPRCVFKSLSPVVWACCPDRVEWSYMEAVEETTRRGGSLSLSSPRPLCLHGGVGSPPQVAFTAAPSMMLPLSHQPRRSIQAPLFYSPIHLFDCMFLFSSLRTVPETIFFPPPQVEITDQEKKSNQYALVEVDRKFV